MKMLLAGIVACLAITMIAAPSHSGADTTHHRHKRVRRHHHSTPHSWVNHGSKNVNHWMNGTSKKINHDMSGH